MNVKGIDALDSACKEHDINCSQGGCSASADRKLALAAMKVYLNPLVNPITRERARLIALAMGLVSFTR